MIPFPLFSNSKPASFGGVQTRANGNIFGSETSYNLNPSPQSNEEKIFELDRKPEEIFGSKFNEYNKNNSSNQGSVSTPGSAEMSPQNRKTLNFNSNGKNSMEKSIFYNSIPNPNDKPHSLGSIPFTNIIMSDVNSIFSEKNGDRNDNSRNMITSNNSYTNFRDQRSNENGMKIDIFSGNESKINGGMNKESNNRIHVHENEKGIVSNNIFLNVQNNIRKDNDFNPIVYQRNDTDNIMNQYDMNPALQQSSQPGRGYIRGKNSNLYREEGNNTSCSSVISGRGFHQSVIMESSNIKQENKNKFPNNLGLIENPDTNKFVDGRGKNIFDRNNNYNCNKNNLDLNVIPVGNQDMLFKNKNNNINGSNNNGGIYFTRSDNYNGLDHTKNRNISNKIDNGRKLDELHSLKQNQDYIRQSGYNGDDKNDKDLYMRGNGDSYLWKAKDQGFINYNDFNNQNDVEIRTQNNRNMKKNYQQKYEYTRSRDGENRQYYNRKTNEYGKRESFRTDNNNNNNNNMNNNMNNKINSNNKILNSVNGISKNFEKSGSVGDFISENSLNVRYFNNNCNFERHNGPNCVRGEDVNGFRRILPISEYIKKENPLAERALSRCIVLVPRRDAFTTNHRKNKRNLDILLSGVRRISTVLNIPLRHVSAEGGNISFDDNTNGFNNSEIKNTNQTARNILTSGNSSMTSGRNERSCVCAIYYSLAGAQECRAILNARHPVASYSKNNNPEDPKQSGYPFVNPFFNNQNQVKFSTFLYQRTLSYLEKLLHVVPIKDDNINDIMDDNGKVSNQILFRGSMDDTPLGGTLVIFGLPKTIPSGSMSAILSRIASLENDDRLKNRELAISTNNLIDSHCVLGVRFTPSKTSHCFVECDDTRDAAALCSALDGASTWAGAGLPLQQIHIEESRPGGKRKILMASVRVGVDQSRTYKNSWASMINYPPVVLLAIKVTPIGEDIHSKLSSYGDTAFVIGYGVTIELGLFLYIDKLYAVPCDSSMNSHVFYVTLRSGYDPNVLSFVKPSQLNVLYSPYMVEVRMLGLATNLLNMEKSLIPLFLSPFSN